MTRAREQRETRTYRIADTEFEVVAAAADAFGVAPATFVRNAAVAVAAFAAEDGLVPKGGETGRLGSSKPK